MTIDLLHMASLAAGPRAGPLAGWPQAIPWLAIGTGTLIGTPLLLLLVWILLRLERLRRHVRLLDRAMDVVGSALFITDAQRPGHPVIAVNPAFARLTGYESRSILGRTGRVLEGPETELPVKKLVHVALRDGRSCRTHATLHARDGRAVSTDLGLTAVHDPRGRHTYTIWEIREGRVLTCEDLTQVKRDARRLASWVPLTDLLARSARLTPACARDLLQIICEHCEWPVGSLWMVDAKANELRCFQTHAAAGATLDQMAGAPRRSTCKPWEGLAGRVWCKGEPQWSADFSQEMDWVPRRPASHTGGVIGQPVRSGGEVIAVVEFFGAENPSKDPSLLPMLASFAALIGPAIARSRAEGEIDSLDLRVRKAQRGEALGSLVGGIAHDLNNTLTAILGFTELVFPAIPATSRARRHLKHIMKAGGRAKDLIHQILTFSRQTEHALSPIRLQEVLQEALKLIRPSLPATIELKASIEPDTPSVLGDPTQLHHVLVNLCANAEYAMRGTQGVLEIQAAAVSVTPELAARRPALREKRYARLTVRDAGCGMPAKVKKRAFEPFFTTKPNGEGSGLGLAVVRGIILQHGGAIYMESTPKHGTTVEIFLPLAEQEVAEEPPPPDALPRGSERVLFVEDEATLAELGRDMLESLGYEVVVRTSPIEALRAFELMPQRFDLLITDQTMPRTTGETLVHEALRIRPDLPVIMMTGFSHTINADKARALGVRAFLHTPLLLRDLARTIRRALDETGLPSDHGGSHGQLDTLAESTPTKQVHEHNAVGPDRR